MFLLIIPTIIYTDGDIQAQQQTQLHYCFKLSYIQLFTVYVSLFILKDYYGPDGIGSL